MYRKGFTMTKRIDYLDPKRLLVEETADWLCGGFRRAGCARDTPEGAKSLAHIMVIVPTAQSGRNLRFALAKKANALGWGGLIPPRIEMPNSLLAAKDVNESHPGLFHAADAVPFASPNHLHAADCIRVATEAEEMAVMAKVLMDLDLGEFPALFPKPPKEKAADWALAMAQPMLGIYGILGERALKMSEVKCDEDAERWHDLAKVEDAFFAELAGHGVMPRILFRKRAVRQGCVEDGIEEILLPGAVDMQGAFEEYLANSGQTVTLLIHADAKDADGFDEWGRPARFFSSPVDPSSVKPAPTAIVEADDIARFFRSVGGTEAYPALAVCDSEMYPEIEGAFQNHFAEDELALRNPSQEQIAKSPLGRLLISVFELSQRGGYEMFSTFVRSGDVARWAAAEMGVAPAEVAKWIGALDAMQNAHLPQTIDDAINAADAEALVAWREEERKAAAGFKRLAEAVKSELTDPFTFLKKIFATLTLDEKNPSDRELVAAAETVRELRADCASDLIPESMRHRLFVELLKKSAYMLEPTAPNVLAAIGWLEIQWCAEDELVIAGFNEGCVPENVVGHPFVPDRLRGQIGISTNERRAMRDSFIFAQAIGCRTPGAVHIHLHQIDGDKNVTKPSRILFPGVSDAALPALALRLYAVTKGSDGVPAKELPSAWLLRLPFPPKGEVPRERISTTDIDQYRRCPFNFYLRETFGEHADDRRQELDMMAFGNLCHGALDDFARNGPKDSVDAHEISAFLEAAVRRRLTEFGANLPAIIELQGAAAIERLRAFSVIQAARRRDGWRIIASEQNLECRIKGCPTLIRGKVDRIDEHETTKELAIIDYKTWDRVSDDSRKSLQLPIYRAMVETSKLYGRDKAHSAKAFYCILAERAEDTKFDEEHSCGEGMQSEMEDEVVKLLTSLAKGIFYPPAKGSDWARDYASLIWESPDVGIDPEWIDDQLARMGVEK